MIMRDDYQSYVWMLPKPPAGSSTWVFKTNRVRSKGGQSFSHLPSGITLRILSRGRGWVRVGETVWELEVGDVFVAIPGVEIEFGDEIENPWSWYEFQLTGEGAMDVVAALGCSGAAPVARPDLPEQAVQLFCDLHILFGSEDRSPHTAIALLHSIIAAVNPKGSGSFEQIGSRARIVAEAGALLESTPQMGVNVAELARTLGVDRTTIQRAFKSETGMSAVAFIRQQRIKRAMELLSATDWTVAQVAEGAGFRSAKYFIRCFREETGQPPGRWRRRN
jgi:AraC-like DNA-binding protein